MRELGARVGLRAQSLYVYFPSKHAIYDALFAQANEELSRRFVELGSTADPESALRGQARAFVEFCTGDPVRYQLLFQRTIPGFEPSEASYAGALEVLDRARHTVAGVGVTDPADLDLYTALIAGLVAQQLSNDPGGDRWTRQLDRVLDMYLAELARGRLA